MLASDWQVFNVVKSYQELDKYNVNSLGLA